MLDEKQKINQIISLSQEIARVNDLDILLERILTVSCQFANADAGSIIYHGGEISEIQLHFEQYLAEEAAAGTEAYLFHLHDTRR